MILTSGCATLSLEMSINKAKVGKKRKATKYNFKKCSSIGHQALVASNDTPESKKVDSEMKIKKHSGCKSEIKKLTKV